MEDQEVEISFEVVHVVPNNLVCEGKYQLSKGKWKIKVYEDSYTQEELDEIDEHLAFYLKKILQTKF